MLALMGGGMGGRLHLVALHTAFGHCRQLGVEQHTRQKIETQEAQAVERVTQVEQEREKERKELRELRKQMAEIERALMQQVCQASCVIPSSSLWLPFLAAASLLCRWP